MVKSNKTILFVHIPKTAGSSFREQILVPNLGDDYKMFRGWKKLWKEDRTSIKMLGGHMPVGPHVLFDEMEYITFLREPIERAISHYYFMVQPASSKYPNANKPHRDLHQKTAFKDIFEATKYQKYRFSVFSLLDNLQTRYLAGYKYYWMPKDSKILINAAKKNLKERIQLFGIKSDFQNSLEMFSNVYGWKAVPNENRLRNTRIKKDVDDETLEVIKQNHVLDLELYDYALELYEKHKKVYL